MRGSSVDASAVDKVAEESVAKALDSLGDIATLPEITLKIIETVEDPRSTARDLHEIVTHDLALSARILRVVNSAFYGLPGQVASIDRAIVMLGLNAVKNIAIAASLSRVFRGGRISRKYTARDMWVHSVAVGVASKMLIDQMEMALPDEAFVGGLIHDIGMVVMLQANAPGMNEMMRLIEDAQRRREEGESLDVAALSKQWEVKLLGASHEQFGAGLAQRWKFPRSFHYVTGYHHEPESLAPENRLLTQVVAVADGLCGQLNLGMTVPLDGTGLREWSASELKLSAEQLDFVRQNLPEQVDQAMGLFG